MPFSHWPISPLLKDNRTNNWPPPQPLTSNTPLLVRCVGVFQKVYTLLYKSLEPPIISFLYVSCRLCGCTALLMCLGSLPCWSQVDPNQSAPFCHFFCFSFVQLQGHTAQHDEMMTLFLANKSLRTASSVQSRLVKNPASKMFFERPSETLKIKLLLKMT